MQMLVVFDSQSNAYYAGQNVTGRLVLRLRKSKTFRSIIIKCNGEAHVKWTEERTKKDKDGRKRTFTEVFVGSEKYFEHSQLVAGGSVGQIEVQPGEVSYPFSFPLPQNCPSSFEGKYGYIRYTIKAEMIRPWKFNQRCKSAFTVVSPLDLNLIPSVQEPVTVQKSKTFCCLFCESGPLELTVRLPASGFVPGQTIPFHVDIENGSNVLVKPVNCVLQREVTWTATKPHYKKKVEKLVIASIAVDERVQPHYTKHLSQDFKIPPLPPSNLQNCSIIDLEYVFKVEAVAGTFHKNLSARIPITLGTVPLLTGPTRFVSPIPPPEEMIPGPSKEGDAPGPSQPTGFIAPTYPSTAPSAPPLYSDLPPPSYEECVFGGMNIRDAEDDEHTMGLTYFTPRYPVWDFDQNRK